MKLSKVKLVFLILIGVVTLTGVVLYVNKYLYKSRASDGSSTSQIVCDINPPNNNSAISAAIDSCPDGTTIRFPANASYSLPDSIFLKDRHNLTIDGQGSTFTITTDAISKPNLPNGGKNGGNWVILRGSNITLKNIKAIGSFPLVGQPRDLAKESAEPGYAEWMSNFGIYGTNGIHLEDLEGRAPWGDMITSGPDTYIDGSTADYASNVVIERVHAFSPSRHCWSLTSGTNQWIEDSTCEDAWYVGTDQEIDEVHQPLVGTHILRNRFKNFNLEGIVVPFLGVTTADIEIKDNVFETGPDVKCNPSIIVGAYPNNPNTFKNVSIENNTVLTYGTGINLDHIEGGTLSNNKITTLDGGGCALGPGKEPPLTSVTNSTGITPDNNGPDAPGAGGISPTAAVNPSPMLTSNPTVTTNPSPNTPLSQSCTAPINFAGTPSPTESGRYDFTWNPSSGATEYNFYFALAPDQPSVLYAGPFANSPASAFSLNPNTHYNFAVRAKCGSSESANSNVASVNGVINPTIKQNPSPTTTSLPSPTAGPNSTVLSFSLLLHGLGKGGDSSNPNSINTELPKRIQRNITVELFNSQNQLVLTKSGTVVFNPTPGNFIGVIDLGPSFPSGVYTVKVKADQFLKKLVPGIQSITQGRVNTLPQVTLTSGDMNNDNRIDALDYNILIDCYADISPAKNCSDPVKKQSADITDDGVVNQFDYNLFLRELTNIAGE